ncbi:MAG: glutathione peroxidase [Calditrichaeota bacterium]|nr:MAG: glutathione peroxidase [Calditrichota bacterium]
MKIYVVLAVIILCTISQAAEKEDIRESFMKNEEKQTVKPEYLSIPFQTITGEERNLGAFEGNVVLLVNVASECGFTKQYAPLEKLYEKYKDSGLVVIGFPANNFGGQEPGSNEEILNFCTSKFDVTFPMMAKVSVKGNDKHPLFSYLTENSDIKGEIEWNFSKFLIDRDGKLVKRFEPKIDPLSKEITDAIKQLL